MDAIPKFLASAYVTILAVFIGISLIICGTSVVSARTFYSNVSDAISSVGPAYEKDMIDECASLAQENGYVLNTKRVNTSAGSYYYELVLEYKFAAPFFGDVHTGTVSGYVYPGTHTNVSV